MTTFWSSPEELLTIANLTSLGELKKSRHDDLFLTIKSLTRPDKFTICLNENEIDDIFLYVPCGVQYMG